MKNFNNLLILLIICLNYSSCGINENDILILKNGEPRAVIILPSQMNYYQKNAVDDFRNNIYKSTGVEIPIVKPELENTILPKVNRIIIGPSLLTEQQGYRTDNLNAEEFRICTKGKDIIILANDIERAKLPLYNNL